MLKWMWPKLPGRVRERSIWPAISSTLQVWGVSLMRLVKSPDTMCRPQVFCPIQ
jgi:hypothetical protein